MLYFDIIILLHFFFFHFMWHDVIKWMNVFYKKSMFSKGDLATGCKTKMSKPELLPTFLFVWFGVHSGMDIVDINEKVFIAILIKLFGMLSAFYITNMYREFEYTRKHRWYGLCCLIWIQWVKKICFCVCIPNQK